MTRVARLLVILSLALPASLHAQDPAEKLLGQHLFPPELVMQHQQRIELKPAQREAITEAIKQFQSKVLDLQWRMQEESQKLATLLEAPAPAEAAVLEQVDRVLALEREVKRAHMALLVKIKGTLTREQQAALRALR